MRNSSKQQVKTGRHASVRKKNRRVPSLRLHKASGQAYVVLNGKAVYCGKHGTPERVASRVTCEPVHYPIRQLPPRQGLRQGSRAGMMASVLPGRDGRRPGKLGRETSMGRSLAMQMQRFMSAWHVIRGDPGGSEFLQTYVAVSGLLLVLTLAGCSHTTPYYRPGIPRPTEISVAHGDVGQRIVLIGDAGDTRTDSATFAGLRQWAGEMPTKTMLVFLGDNIYPAGMPKQSDPSRKDAEQRLSAQLAVVKDTGARAFFLSGNHDWANDSKGGLEAVRRQEDYVNRSLSGEGHFLPRNGSPGPIKVDLEGVRIVVLNTAWWLHQEGAAASSNPEETKRSATEELTRLVSTPGNRHVIVVAHHPLVSHGTQGGFYDWKDHLFPSTHLARSLWVPTPVLGSLYPLLRAHVFNRQTLGGREYKEMRKQLTEALSKNKPLIYAAGHDHGLQVLEGGSAAEYMLVSAIGLDVGASLSHGKDTLFAHLHPGFMVMDFLTDGGALLRVVEPGDKAVVFAMWLTSRSPTERRRPDGQGATKSLPVPDVAASRIESTLAARCHCGTSEQGLPAVSQRQLALETQVMPHPRGVGETR